MKVPVCESNIVEEGDNSLDLAFDICDGISLFSLRESLLELSIPAINIKVTLATAFASIQDLGMLHKP